MPGLAQALSQLAPATLRDLDAVALLNRVDTKYLLTLPRLLALLPSLAREYRVLDIEGRRLHQYRTLYFDTPNLDLYRHHQAGQAIRHKVRSRAYVDSGLSFFEIKSKTSDRRTVKHRLATPGFVADLTPDTGEFLTTHVPSAGRSLVPVLRNDFFRITLVGKRAAERLTLDVNIQFDCDGRTAVLPGIVIAELKQSDLTQPSPFRATMQAEQILPTSISKYCVGVALLVADVEHDVFDQQLRTLERLIRDGTAERVEQAAGWAAVGG